MKKEDLQQRPRMGRKGERALVLVTGAILLVLAASLLVGCAGTYTTISPQEVQQRLAADPSIFLLDVRTPGEYSAGHIPGAVLIPVQELKSRLTEVPKDRTIIVYCLSAERSSEAAGILAGEGYGEVINMGEGIRNWRGPIER